jgi:uncharacterized phage protein (TIGR01671 family)
MSRVIKFRAWDAAEKRMSQWFNLAMFGVYFGDLEDGLTLPFVASNPERFTLMQFTGLTDKNGKEIYELDLVTVRSQYETDEPIECNATVIYREGSFRLDFYDMILNEKVCKGEGNWSIEVIGNFYQNSDVLA